MLSPQTPVRRVALDTEARGFKVSPAGAQRVLSRASFEVTTSHSEPFSAVRYPENIGGEALPELCLEELVGFPQLEDTSTCLIYSGFVTAITSCQIGTRCRSYFAPTAFKRPVLNFLVSVRGDCFTRPEDTSPITALDLGFPDQPTARKAGSVASLLLYSQSLLSFPILYSLNDPDLIFFILLSQN